MKAQRERTGFGLLCVLAVSAFAPGASAQQFDGLGYRGPETQGRPGEIYFQKGVEAVRHKDYAFAVQMYEAAASWAYKDAEYNLGVMYLHGEGVPVDRPRAMAWIALAAERNDKKYVDAREVVYADLSQEEFARANEIYRQIKPEYGDETAMRRAKNKWVETRNEATGSHLGFVGNLAVGADSPRGFAYSVPQTTGGAVGPGPLKGPPDGFATAAFGFTGGDQIDGTIAYRQLQATDNPYDPRFNQGTATVGPLVPAGAKTDKNPAPNNAPVTADKPQP